MMQNTLVTAQTVSSEGRISQPFKDGKLGMIDARDIGELGAKILTEKGHEGELHPHRSRSPLLPRHRRDVE
jgi:hypothetical protein